MTTENSIDNLFKENKEKDRLLKIKDEYFRLIHDLGYDYDGLEKPESLKQLIDELVDLANKGYIADDKAAIYDDFNGHKKNILLEPIGDEKNEEKQ